MLNILDNMCLLYVVFVSSMCNKHSYKKFKTIVINIGVKFGDFGNYGFGEFVAKHTKIKCW